MFRRLKTVLLPFITLALVFITGCGPGYWGMGPGAGPGRGPGGMMYGYGGGVMWILLLVLAAVIIYLLIGTGRKSSGQAPVGHRETALDILEKRYARGEISKEEFEQMKNDLNR